MLPSESDFMCAMNSCSVFLCRCCVKIQMLLTNLYIWCLVLITLKLSNMAYSVWNYIITIEVDIMLRNPDINFSHTHTLPYYQHQVCDPKIVPSRTEATFQVLATCTWGRLRNIFPTFIDHRPMLVNNGVLSYGKSW